MSEPIEGGCQHCGRLIDESAHGYDDVVSAPFVTESGDVFCIPCGREMAMLERRERGEYEGDFECEP